LSSKKELAFLTIAEAAKLIRQRKISSVELTELMLARIAAFNPKLHAYITICDELARKQARAAEREIQRGHYRGPLHGIPISLKDNIYTKGIRTTAGSKILRNFVPDSDADIVLRLKGAGAILLGKTNMNEFAYGVTGENPFFDDVRNPWDITRMPGGSSAGSCAALAAGMCYGSVGSDTGGSCRIPAALCGVAGVKPLKQDVSSCGVIDLAPSLDHVGPLARSIEDAALVYAAISKPQAPGKAAVQEYARLRQLRVGVPREFFFTRLDPEVRALVERAIGWFTEQGARLREVRIPGLQASEQAGTDIALPEATTFHSRMGWWPHKSRDYSPAVRKRLALGAGTFAADYLRAFDQKMQLQHEFKQVFASADILVVPTTPLPAPKFGDKIWKSGAQEESIRAALLRLCRPANLTTWPALSVPCGFTRAGLPVGLQVMTHCRELSKGLAVAAAYERAHAWHTLRPPLADLPE
jgi:aspartyl-tRNA(Asn)/glutamyl-tRNA(Gln) amidotransferase subunit A